MFCKKCGKEIIDNEKFCSECGTGVDDDGNFEKHKPKSVFRPLWVLITFLLPPIGLIMSIICYLRGDKEAWKLLAFSIFLIIVYVIIF